MEGGGAGRGMVSGGTDCSNEMEVHYIIHSGTGHSSGHGGAWGSSGTSLVVP